MKKLIAHLSPDIHPLETMDNIFRKIDADVVAKECYTEEEVIDLAANADGIFVAASPMTEKVIDKLTKCKVISCSAMGTDNIDHNAATKRNIVVTYVPDFAAKDVSDHALMFILTCSKKFDKLNKYVRNSQWTQDRLKQMAPRHSLDTQTLGLVGFGCIGRQIAQKAKVLGLNIIAHDPYIDSSEFRKYDVKPAALDELLKTSDFVILILPLTKQTENLIGQKQFSMMKPTAYLINIARGRIVEEKALINALENNVIAGAALDCMATEPPEKDNPLFELENVIFSPHIAGYSEESIHYLRQTTAQQLIDVLQNKKPLHIKNPEVLQKVKLVEK